MSVRDLFHKNQQAISVGKYLKKSAPSTLGDGIESEAHLVAALSRSNYYLPDIDYSNPENFVKYGSAKEYYKNAFSYIANYYPYDGSFLERTQFYNNISPIEKYVLEEIYPRSTGFVTIGANYGAITPNGTGYYSSSIEQLIRIKGGPHSGSVYSEVDGRTSNLEFGGLSGSTVEFFLKKNSGIDKDKNSERQVIFDLWNGAAYSDASYGRMRIELMSASAGAENKFLVTYRSGSKGFATASIPSAGTIDIADGTWRHFAFTFDGSGTKPVVQFFTNGKCIETVTTGSTGKVGLVTGSMIANLGALRTDVEESPGAAAGFGKLSGSLDEFRFWKKKRNAEEIGRYWFDDVGGGSNKYNTNVALGAYLKFNEGITNTASIDQIMLDYSGRLSNGHYVGYNAANSRNTGSAIDQLNLTSVREVPDPIIRTSSSLYQTLYNEYLLSGSYYDGLNTSRLLNHLPSWIIEAEEQGANEIVSLTQIIATYFDTLYNQLTAMKELKYITYNSGSLSSSMNEFPHNDRLIENIGIETPEIFANIGTLQKFLKRDEQITFDQRLVDIKNAIYKNIYNNVNFILKSKGNEKSIRNFVRCLGVGEDIISLNTYSNNSDFVLTSSYTIGSSAKKFADFSALQYVGDANATAYQYYDATNPNSVGLITGSASSLNQFAFSLQSEVLFPNKQNYEALSYTLPGVVSSSLVGFHTPGVTNPTSTVLTWAGASDDKGLQLYAVKSPAPYPEVYAPLDRVMDAYFVVRDRAGAALLKTDIYANVYDNQKWNFTLSLRPKKYSLADGINGARVNVDGYILELHGINYDNGVIKNQFTKTKDLSYAVGSAIVNSTKRVYAGAHRQNYTSTVLQQSDVKISSVLYWTDYIPPSTANIQAHEVDSFGRRNPYENAYSFQTGSANAYIPKIQTLALNWDFANITGSDASGRFIISDFSSGSSTTNYPDTYQGSLLSSINLRQHTGRGDFFSASSTPVRKEYVYTQTLQGPEYISSDDMIQVLSSDDETFGVNVRPENFYFAIERSMYRSISNRMLQLFASIEEFNNLIGAPVNKYRDDYKQMEKMKEIFFRQVDISNLDLEKYVKYYKWLDSAMGEMIEQLLPGSARYAKNVRKIVESHVLERPKIKYGNPTVIQRLPFPEGEVGIEGNVGGPNEDLVIEGDPNDGQIPPIIPPGTPPIPRVVIPQVVNTEITPHPIPDAPGVLRSGQGPRFRSYGWRYNHAPINGQQNTNAPWWQLRAERYNTVISQSGPTLYPRQAIQKAFKREINAERVAAFSMQFSQDLDGGINNARNKKSNFRDFTFDAFEPLQDILDEPIPNRKRRRNFRATIGSGPATATFVITDSGGIINGETFVLIDFQGTSTTYTINGGLAPAMGGGSGGSANVGFSGVGGGAAGKIAAANAIKAAINATTDASYTAVSDGVDTVTITQSAMGISGNRKVTSGLTAVTVTDFTGGFSESYVGAQIAPFSVFKTSVISGVNAQLVTLGLRHIDLTNMHQDNIHIEAGGVPMQGPYTNQHVGGFQARHVPPFRTEDRREKYTLTIANSTGTMESITVGDIPKGQYLRGLAAKRPVSILNIRTVTGSHTPSMGIAQVGNYVKDYEVINTAGRIFNNPDFVFNTASYNYTMPSAFVAPPAMRTAGLSGAFDYPAPRQRSGRRINDTIFVNRFSSPGDKADSKQQFRDVNSDEYSPNSVLPYRNMHIRSIHNTNLTAHVLFGGYASNHPTKAAIYKTNRNKTLRVQLSGSQGGAGWTESYITASVFDNGFIVRPIPAGDSTQWFMSTSGSNTNTFSDYVVSGSRYPQNISILKSVASAFSKPVVYLDTANIKRYMWAANSNFAPWTQLRAGQSNQGSYYNRNNIYELEPLQTSIEISVGGGNSALTKQNSLGTLNRQVTDRGENTLTYYYSRRYREAPLTSRYKPLLHRIVTPLGTPTRDGDNTTTLGLHYSYGNVLMGFAHRELNRKIYGRLKYAHGQIKRPYEILRDQRVSNLPGSVNGVDLIKTFEYPETIYPKEVYTYLSGTRARLSYSIEYWRDDVAYLPNGTLPTNVTTLRVGTTIAAFNKQLPRFKSPFYTSQGYLIQAEEQKPYNSLDGSTARGTGAGSGSIWPLDSYLYVDSSSSLAASLTSSVPVILADAATMAAGELMMTHYGTINDKITNASYRTTPGSANYQTASINSAQYVYNTPTEVPRSTTVPAVAATGALTGVAFQGQGNASATATLTVGPTATKITMVSEEITLPDPVDTIFFEFASSGTGFTYDSPSKTYTVNLGSAGSVTDIRNSLFDAIDNARSTAVLGVTPVKGAPAGQIQLTASAAGASYNSKTITNVLGLSSGVGVASWAGGTDYDLNGLTVTLTDVAHGTVTYTMDKTVNVAGSTATTIGVQDATSANLVADAINNTINLSKGAGAINITPTSPPANIIVLTADTAGSGMNGKAVAGTYLTSPYGAGQNFAGGAASTVEVTRLPEPRSPGSSYTRPSWNAGSMRRYVDGPNKGTIASSRYPFYDTYEKYAEDVRLAGQEYTIIPEFRISEHVSSYQANGSLVNIVSASLSITGSNATIFDGTNTAFYERFGLTDTPEFLPDFMPFADENKNFIFNNYPRHFEIQSEAVAKLLPYNGFYPVMRSLDLAKSFYTSYSPQAVFSGQDAAKTQAWRSIYKPFLAPGILYNSIKSGMAVDHPIRRATRSSKQYLSQSAFFPVNGCLTGTLTSAVTSGDIPGNRRRNAEKMNWADENVNSFFWGDRLPFEAIMDPASYLEHGFDLPVVLSDLNEYLHYDATGSISLKGLDDGLYKKAVSNFLANVPRFFLRKKFNKFGDEGYLTKFVSQFGSPSKDSQEISNPVRTVTVDKTSAYMMEVGLLKTDQFNLYSNPYAFGVPTASGSKGWDSFSNAHQIPSGSDWPLHRGEFAPFTPPYYYGPSMVRLLFIPNGEKEQYTLEEITNNNRGELFVQYLNESGSYYDFTSGSFVDRDNNTVKTTASPDYGWNRAWQNRMDLDASVNIYNQFPLGAGGTYISSNPNKWTIMPKWESPILDFPNRSSATPSYNFSSSLAPGSYTTETQGMWHQYGVMPNDKQGVYMYVKDIPTGKDEEYDYVGIGLPNSTSGNNEINYRYVKKIPKFVIDADREVRSLADLCGFDPDEIIRKGFDTNKAKRLGEIAEDGEKSLSEAILAIPIYMDEKQNIRTVTLGAPANKLGPKIKEFRKAFTKYSLPPALAHQLAGLIPKGYPNISDTINPFGDDDYDSILMGESIYNIPVVYLMEHSIQLSRQDLADVWQGVLPDIGKSFQMSFSAIDHYMPGDNVEDTNTKFPEVLKQQINLNVERTGHPRYDLLDIASPGSNNGFFPEIKWLVFKVKERGLTDFTQMVMEEVDGPAALGYDNLRAFISRTGMSEEALSALDERQDTFAKNSYFAKHGVINPTYNWPYDYFSLLEVAKISTKIGFRPDLEREYQQAVNPINIDIPQNTSAFIMPSPANTLDIQSNLSYVPGLVPLINNPGEE